MESFTILSSIAAPLPRVNVDTDAIIAVKHMYIQTKTGLGEKLFYRWRFEGRHEDEPPFVLDRPEYAGAGILVCGANFGCGSSREHAVWALRDFGIRCLIAPSFASIFQENCFKNGVLPATLPPGTVEALLRRLEEEPGTRLEVDLLACTVTQPDRVVNPFTVNPLRRESLLNGLDSIGAAMQHKQAIEAFQARERARRPWIWGSPE